MKQENRFVGQLFHFLAPFINMEKDLLICADGAAAARHSSTKESCLVDSDLPDLWLTFCGNSKPTGIEAKIDERNLISIRQAQLKAWRSGGKGSYQPTFWVATNKELTEFFCWHHSTLRPRPDSTRNTVDNVSLSIRDYPPDQHSVNIAEFALFILTQHWREARPAG